MHYLVSVTEYNDGTATKKSIYEYDSQTACVAQFHKSLGSAMDAATVARINLVAIDGENGSQPCAICWTRPTEAE